MIFWRTKKEIDSKEYIEILKKFAEFELKILKLQQKIDNFELKLEDFNLKFLKRLRDTSSKIEQKTEEIKESDTPVSFNEYLQRPFF